MRLILSTFILTSIVAVSACKKEETNPTIEATKKKQNLVNTYAGKIKEPRNWHRYYDFYSNAGNPPNHTDTLSDTTFAVIMINDSTAEILKSKVPLTDVTDSTLYYQANYDPHVTVTVRYDFVKDKAELSHSSGGMGGGSRYRYVSY